MFASKLNTMTGNLDWEIVNEDYDFHQELARAGFADMLHDYERNRKYYDGLRKIIGKLKSENRPVHVLDIGTGTGLLSMMAVRCGADRVTACEAFRPMIDVAHKCIDSNGMRDKIKIIEKRSTEIEVGPGKDMDERANVLVTEVFDTELIGEGAISTFSHALQHLLVKDCFVIPDNAVMFVQIVDSPSCYNWHWLNLHQHGLKCPEDYANPAGNSIFDVQLAQFDDFKPLTRPLEAFRFSFSGKEPLVFDEDRLIHAASIASGKTHALMMWWEIRMDFENEIVLSCAPPTAHPTPDQMQWRDHWMQAIYFPSRILDLKQDETFVVSCNHDEYSLWFDVYNANMSPESISSAVKLSKQRSLGMSLVSRNRLSQLNDFNRNNMFINLFKKYESADKNLLIVNDDLSILPLLAASRTIFNKIITLETNRFRQKCLESLIAENKLESKIIVINSAVHQLKQHDLENLTIDVVMSECSFCQALLPWDNLYYFYGLEHLFRTIDTSVKQSVKVMPIRIRFCAVAISMQDLHKIRYPVGSSEGFSLAEFDKVILEACKKTDGFMEPHPLWEYPSQPLSDVHEIYRLEFTNAESFKTEEAKCVQKTVKLNIIHPGTLNGVAIWYELDYDENSNNTSEFKVNTGLLQPPQANRNLVWSRDFKQAVHILDKQYHIDHTNKSTFDFNCLLNFNIKSGSFKLDFIAKP